MFVDSGIELMGTFYGDACFVMLVLFFSCIVPPVVAVTCIHCNGNIASCTGSDDCPLNSGVLDNAKALIAGADSLVVVAKLLPFKILRVLPRTVLDAMKAMVKTPSGTFDFSTASLQEVFDVVVHGYVSPSEATVHVQGKLLASSDAKEINKLTSMLSVIRDYEKKGDTGRFSGGALLYLWALSARCLGEGESVALKLAEEGTSGGGVKMVRPTTNAATFLYVIFVSLPRFVPPYLRMIRIVREKYVKCYVLFLKCVHKIFIFIFCQQHLSLYRKFST